MEGATLTDPTAGNTDLKPFDKGLKTNAIGYMSNLVISVASTAPAYSLAATLGFVVLVAGVGVQAPAVLIVAFVPMLLIAGAYKYMNKADPDCGTTFTWATRAFGPQTGWLGGWGIIAADVIVMASLSQIAGLYTFHLWYANPSPSSLGVIIVGVGWIVIMTWICYIGIELSARLQTVLLSLEVITLMSFAVIVFIDVYTGQAGPHAIKPELSWFNPLDISSVSTLATAVLVGIFIYWGWDSGVAVNEESEDAANGPGKAAVISTLLLVVIYVVVTAAAQSYNGTAPLTANASDIFAYLGPEVLPKPLSLLLIITVLTSTSASTQTTILPTARTSLSMARWGAIPKVFGRVHPRHKTPSVSTILFGIISVIWFVTIDILVAEQCSRRLGRRDRLHGLLLLRAYRLRLRVVLPQAAAQERQELLLRRPRPAARWPAAARSVHQGLHLLRPPGEQLLQGHPRARASRRDRDRLRDHRGRARDRVSLHAARLLPGSQDRGCGSIGACR